MRKLVSSGPADHVVDGFELLHWKQYLRAVAEL